IAQHHIESAVKEDFREIYQPVEARSGSARPRTRLRPSARGAHAKQRPRLSPRTRARPGMKPGSQRVNPPPQRELVLVRGTEEVALRVHLPVDNLSLQAKSLAPCRRRAV